MRTTSGYCRWIGLVLLGPGLGAVLFGSACSQRQSTVPTATESRATAQSVASSALATTPNAISTANDFDRQFIDMMVPHHEGALEMARVAQTRTPRPEILALAQQILSAQESEIAQMRKWRLAWFGSTETPSTSKMPMLSADPGMAAMTMDMQRDVELLRAAPEPFDRAFIDAMIVHHQSAIDAARLARQHATHPEIQDLSLSIIEGQLTEIGQMRIWRQTWMFSDSPTPVPGVQIRDMPAEMGH